MPQSAIAYQKQARETLVIMEAKNGSHGSNAGNEVQGENDKVELPTFIEFLPCDRHGTRLFTNITS